jgi:hypothetical protein
MMPNPQICAVIDDGPRAGQTALLEANADGSPTRTITLADPASSRTSIEDGSDIGDTPPGTTTYELRDFDDALDAYLYRVVRP